MRVLSLLYGLAVCLAYSTSGLAQTKPALVIAHLTGDFYIYTTYKVWEGAPFPSNSMYLLTDSGVVLFDTPWDTTQFQPLLDSINAKHHSKVILCIATHFHDDRTAGLGFLRKKGVSTWTSKQTYDLCKGQEQKLAEHCFTKDTVFTVGNHSFRIYYPGEGHAPDNIVVWFASEKILYGGCFVKSIENNSLGNLSDANIPAWRASVKATISEFPHPAYIIPGHFSWKSKKALQHTLKLLEADNR